MENAEVHHAFISHRNLMNCIDEDVANDLESHGADNVKRIVKKTKHGNPRKSHVFRFTFVGKELPATMKVDFCTLIVHPFPKIPHCLNCQMLGHLKINCRNLKCCEKCLKSVHDDPCERICCRNCGSQEHFSWADSCPELKRAKKLQLFKIRGKLSFAEAKLRFDLSYPREQQVLNDFAQLSILTSEG